MSYASEIVIDVTGLTKKFGSRTVVRDLSMKVKRGTIYGFLGPNGSGKTTTIRMLCGLLTADEGTGTCLGYDIRTESDKIKRRTGYMTQRSEGAAGLLERDSRARGGRADGAGLDPLHGRGRALSRNRVYRLWRALDPRHRG
jgi:ABC-2 type transport system ATP-binding protein